MIQSLVTLFSIVFGSLCTALLTFVVAPFDSSGGRINMLARLWARFILKCSRVKVRMRGSENILKNRPQVFFSNHQSYFDIFALMGYLPVQLCWIAKKELFDIPVFGTGLKKAGFIRVERSGTRSDVLTIRKAAERIRKGVSVVIFPEGSRSPDGRLMRFKSGGAALAIEAGVASIPIIIQGSGRVLPKGSLRVRPGMIEVTIAPPIDTTRYGRSDRKRLMEDVRRTIVENLGEEKRDRKGDLDGIST